MDIKEKVEIVTKLQKISHDVVTTVLPQLSIGMSEVEIAEIIRKEFEKREITEFWYDVPQNVLIGAQRFKIATTTFDYSVKKPSAAVILEEDSPLFIDLSPIDPVTKIWGDWARTIIFKPGLEADDEQVKFLKEFRQIQLDGFSHITAESTGEDVANFYTNAFKKNGTLLIDVRNNVGHSMHEGPKTAAKRIWLDAQNTIPLGEGIFAIEPGGIRLKKDGKGIVVGRFEDCIYVSKNSPAVVLGEEEELPLYV